MVVPEVLLSWLPEMAFAYGWLWSEFDEAEMEVVDRMIVITR